MNTAATSQLPVFDVQIDDAYQRLRSALTAAMHTVRGGPTFPQDLARFLKINKNLAWRISKIISLHTPEQGIVHMPGPQGMKLLLQATQAAGASPEVIAQVQEAHEKFLEVIKFHAGDNETLEILLDSRPNEGGIGSLETSRQIAYKGNSGVCGVRAHSKLNAFFLAPSKDHPEKLDTQFLNGYVDITRLRDVESILLFRSPYSVDFGESGEFTSAIPLPDEYELFDDLPNFDNANLSWTLEDENIAFKLGRGPVGLGGRSSVFFSCTYPSFVNRYAMTPSCVKSLVSTIEVPVRAQIFDIFVHKDLQFTNDLKLSVYHLPAGGFHIRDRLRVRDRLPIEISPQLLPGDPDACALPELPGYAEYVRRANERYGYDLDDFTCVRFVVEFPPMHSTVAVVFPIDQRPE